MSSGITSTANQPPIYRLYSTTLSYFRRYRHRPRGDRHRYQPEAGAGDGRAQTAIVYI